MLEEESQIQDEGVNDAIVTTFRQDDVGACYRTAKYPPFKSNHKVKAHHPHPLPPVSGAPPWDHPSSEWRRQTAP